MGNNFLIYDFEGTKRAIKIDYIIAVEVKKVNVLKFSLKHDETLSFRCKNEKEAEEYFNYFLDEISKNKNHVYIDLKVI